MLYSSQMILFICFLVYIMFRFVVLFFLHNVLTFFCFCSFSGQCWPVAVVCVPPQERRLRPFKALWHRHLPAKQMYSSSWSSSSSSSSSSWSSSSSSSSSSSKQEYSSIVLVPASQASTRICQFEHTRPWCLGHSEIEMGSPSHNQHQCHIGMVLD